MAISVQPLDNAEDELRVTYAGAKRRIAALEQQLQTLLEAGTKRKSYALMLCIPTRFLIPMIVT